MSGPLSAIGKLRPFFRRRTSDAAPQRPRTQRAQAGRKRPVCSTGDPQPVGRGANVRSRRGHGPSGRESARSGRATRQLCWPGHAVRILWAAQSRTDGSHRLQRDHQRRTLKHRRIGRRRIVYGIVPDGNFTGHHHPRRRPARNDPGGRQRLLRNRLARRPRHRLSSRLGRSPTLGSPLSKRRERGVSRLNASVESRDAATERVEVKPQPTVTCFLSKAT